MTIFLRSELFSVFVEKWLLLCFCQNTKCSQGLWTVLNLWPDTMMLFAFCSFHDFSFSLLTSKLPIFCCCFSVPRSLPSTEICGVYQELISKLVGVVFPNTCWQRAWASALRIGVWINLAHGRATHEPGNTSGACALFVKHSVRTRFVRRSGLATLLLSLLSSR
jgi:hypothetical protein